MPKVTDKTIQIHIECICGFNCIDQEIYPVKWKDFNKIGIVRRKDISNGKYFLLNKKKYSVCPENHVGVDY